MLPVIALIAALGMQNGAPIHVTVDATVDRHPISPLIYGVNHPEWKTSAQYLTLTRLGGNRWTAFNWENNASNAGSDWHFQNDDLLGGGDIPGEAVRVPVAAAEQAGASIIVTVPMAGYVAADKKGDGDIRQTPDYMQTRLVKSEPHKNGPFAYPPDTTDHVVYQDEFVHWLEGAFPRASRPAGFSILYCLDNEPDIWSGTHAEVHPGPLTYQEIMKRTTEYAMAIKHVAPAAMVLGPVSYGWNGFVTLQNAPDANDRDFLEFYLDGMKAAEQAAGHRLLDVLDLHWYPEARGGGKRITEGVGDSAEVAARLQAPRSLWDPTYKEDSWIQKDSLKGAIKLLPRIKAKIAKHYPGTRIGISEYSYGGESDISGALAEADALGIFGREDVYEAALWNLDKVSNFTYGAFHLYRNYDRHGAHFGDVSIGAQSDDVVRSSAYASIDSQHPERLTVVLVNKSNGPSDFDIAIQGLARMRLASVYQITRESAEPVDAGVARVSPSNRLAVTVPAMCAELLEVRP
jgi:hypothetical protein